MSNPTHLRRAGLALAVGCAFTVVPVAAQAATPVNLETVAPFVVLGGQEVTNSGPSVLNGDLGVAPGTSLVGFGSPAVVNGATHNNDAVAAQAQADLTAAYDVAAGQPILAGDDLTGQNLGGQRLTAGAYEYTSGAQLTGTLTLDAENDPNAQFVIKVGSQLTTASASRVELANDASPCNVFWQIGSSAVLGSTTSFQGNLMALTSISLNNGATVTGRVLARNGTVSLINNVLDNTACRTASTSPTPTPTPTPAPTPTPTPTPGTPTGTSINPVAPPSGLVPVAGPPRARPATAPAGNPTQTGTAITRRTPRATCTAGFRATVRGRQIKRVVFSLDGRRIASRSGSPFAVYVRGLPGRHKITARATFTDATRAKTMTFAYRVCAAAVRNPRRGPSRFAG